MYVVNKIFSCVGIFILIILCNIDSIVVEIFCQSNSTNIIENEVAESVTSSRNLQIDVTIEGTFYDDNMKGGNGNDKLFGMEGNDNIRGNSGDDLLVGNEGDDILNGGDGDDELDGGEGNDQLDGGIGKDKLKGGKGSDKYICDKNDTVIGFDSTEGDSKNGSCKIKDKGLLSDFGGKNQEDKNSKSKGQIFPN